MPLIPGQVVNSRYRVISLLGEGGMGAVYEAADATLNVNVALKEMVPYPGTPDEVLLQLREQFQQEAQLLAGLRHPNLPRVSDHFEEDGNAYLVMDYIYGRRLDEVVFQEGRMSEEEVLGWARQLLEALGHCHEQGVIHRDVKPQNVIITWQGQPVLVDFGLAKFVDPNDPRTRTVMRGLGTPEYAPPEQYDTKRGMTDARTDIYSLAATLYHALVGEPPPTVSERIVDPECLKRPKEWREEISDEIDQVLMKALKLQPSQRFQSAGEMYQSLFGVPLPSGRKLESIVPSGAETTILPDPVAPSGFLPWISTGRPRLERRLGLALVAALSLLAVLSVFASNRVFSSGSGGAPAVAARSATVTPTQTSTATSTSTSVPRPSPTTPAPAMVPTVAPVLELAALDDLDPVASGAALTYTLTYSNAGESPVSGMTVRNTLDPNVSFVSASISPTRRLGSTLYWYIGDLSPSISSEIVVSVTVACGLAQGTTLTNSVLLDSREIAPLTVIETTEVSGTDPRCAPRVTPTTTPPAEVTPGLVPTFTPESGKPGKPGGSSEKPTQEPSEEPTEKPTEEPTQKPPDTPRPTPAPSEKTTSEPEESPASAPESPATSEAG